MSFKTPYYELAFEKVLLDTVHGDGMTTRDDIKQYIISKGHSVSDLYFRIAVDNLVKNGKAEWSDTNRRFLRFRLPSGSRRPFNGGSKSAINRID